MKVGRWTRLLRPRVEFEPRDFWVGVYIGEVEQATINGVPSMLHDDRRIYVCLIPCLPIVFTVRRERP